MVELDILGVRIELPSNQPLVLLKEHGGERHLPIWIGAPEASAIAMAQQGITTPRPMTHDLLVSVVASLGRRVTEARIVSVEDTVFHARLYFDNGAEVDARASDAIAVALRVACPLTCAPAVLEDAGVIVGQEQGGDGEEDQVERFREFLADVEPEDFEG